MSDGSGASQSLSNLNSNWYEHFFAGEALELWRRAISHETTEEEVRFLCEVLEVQPGGHLLDVPCGNGRLSLPLCQVGYKITAVDFCLEFLDEARSALTKLKASADKGSAAGGAMPEVDFVRADMLSLSWSDQFDGAYCMGNSFGYFDREGTRQFLGSVARSLRAGAKFVLDSAMLAESFLLNGGEREWVQLDDMYMLVENIYSPRLSCVETNYTFMRAGKEEKRQSTHWIYTCGELCAMLESSGFSVLELLSSTDFEPYELGSERLLLIAEKQ